MLVEVCANSIESALSAEAAGAGRIEFCSELAVGGITPSAGMLSEIRDRVRIPVRVLVRPRSGDFVYSGAEFSAMLRDIGLCTDLGFDGVVSGCLLASGEPDVDRTKELVAAAQGRGFTFHRAFDRCRDPRKALQVLDEIGVDTILSSGQAASAPLGISLLEDLQQEAGKVRFMPGGGIRPENVHLFIGKGFGAVHLSGIANTDAVETYHGPPMNSPAMLRETTPLQTDTGVVSAVIDQIGRQVPGRAGTGALG